MQTNIQKTILQVLGVFFILLTMSTTSGGLETFLEIPSTLFVVIAAIAGRFIYNRSDVSTFVLAFGVLAFLLSVVHIIVSMENIDDTIVSFAIAILPMVNAFVIVIYILNINQIYRLPAKELTLTKKTKGFWISHIVLTILIMLDITISTGLGSFINIPSFFLLAPALLTLFIVKDIYTKLLLLKNYVLATPFIAMIIGVTDVLLTKADPSKLGPIIALVLISSIYTIYIYFTLLKPYLLEAKIEESVNEKTYLIFIMILNSMFVLVLFYSVLN